MSLATINTYAAAAAAAVLSGDYATAIRYALACKPLLAALADSERHDQSLKWANTQQIDGFVTECRREQAAASVASDGLRASRVTYANPTTVDDYS